MYTEASSKFNAFFYNVPFLSLSFFSPFSFNIPTLARYNYQHNQLLDHEPLLFVISQPCLYPLFPLRPRLCVLYIFFFFKWTQYVQRGTSTAPDAECTEAAQIERNWATTVLMRYTSNWRLFLLPIVQYYLCDVRVILRRERCYMIVIAPSLVRV